MTKFKQKIDFISFAEQRGYIQQVLDKDNFSKKLNEQQTAYIGYDATAPSLHVGSLVTLMLVRLWIKAGMRIVILFGGGTTKVGDPSFKDKQRPLLDESVIKNNIERQKSIIAKILLTNLDDNSIDYQSIINCFEFNVWYDNKVKFIDNSQWLDNLNYLEFLRDIGKHFSINRMLSFESVKARLSDVPKGSDGGMSFLEFNYMILQAYDFLHLYQNEKCHFQFGGSDQWGNIVNGVDLIRKVLSKKAYALTVPLLTTSSGAKMGKTEKGAVWLNPDSLSDFDFWQFFRNTSDQDVAKFLKVFTEISLDEIYHVEKLNGDKLNPYKELLANQITTIVRGLDAANQAQNAATSLFANSANNQADLPSFELENKLLTDGKIDILQILLLTKFASSKGEAKRLIANQGIRIDDLLVDDNQAIVDFNKLDQHRLSFGKKKHLIIKLAK